MENRLIFNSVAILVLFILGLHGFVLAQSIDNSRNSHHPAECRQAPVVTNVAGLLTPPHDASVVRVVKPIEVSTSISIDVDLCFTRNGRLDIAEGTTLVSNGNIYAGMWQVFNYLDENSKFIAPKVSIIYPEWWGAQADDNSNDSAALRYAGSFLSNVGGGKIELSSGSYIVGEQYKTSSNLFPLQHKPILEIKGASNPIEINGNGAKLIIEDGLYFGYFDPVSGQPAVPVSCGANSSFAANAYIMINLEFNQDVTVRDLELDGNMANLTLGAACPDGRQLIGYGIRAYNNEQMLIENIYAHHNATDGLVIGYDGLTADEVAKPHIVRNLISEYNARQGFSWVGGNSLVLDNCKLNHTGKARFSSPPGAGFDIEAENSVTRNGLVNNCEFINNKGPGVVADSGDGGYTTVKNSTLWGTNTWALWAQKPGMVFEDSYIYGSVPNPFGSTTQPELATRFSRCFFEDREYGELGVYRSSALLEIEGDNVVIEDSEIIANKVRAIWLDGIATREIVRNVIITHADDERDIGDFQSLFRGSELNNVHFKESFNTPPTTDPDWYVQVENVTYSNVCVDGPWVRWSGTTGCPVP